MNLQLEAIRERLRSAVWVIPAALLLLAVVTGVTLPLIDRAVGQEVSRIAWLTTTADGARTILSTIAGSTVTVAGVVFSLTMVMLSIASSQFGTRVLRNRMQERSTQVAVGALLGSTIYCLLVLRGVGGFDEEGKVPHISVTVAILMALASLLVVVFFLRDMTTAIQAPYIVASLAADLDASIDRLFPEKIGYETEREDLADDSWQPPDAPQSLASSQEGYIQAIDGDTLMGVARKHGLLIYLRRRPGDFLASGVELAEVWGASEIGDEVAAAVNAGILTGRHRTPWQDVNCSIHELAQVAVRALSPGINDPFTAMNSIDRLGAALMRLVERKTPSRFRYDDEGRLRIVANPVTFAESLAAAFNQIRLYANSSVAVSTRLLEALESIAGRARREADRTAIMTQTRLLVEACDASLKLSSDRDVIRQQMQRVAGAFPGAKTEAQPEREAASEEERNGSQEEAEQAEVSSVGKGEVNG